MYSLTKPDFVNCSFVYCQFLMPVIFPPASGHYLFTLHRLCNKIALVIGVNFLIADKQLRFNGR